jgi:hypothetical protein
VDFNRRQQEINVVEISFHEQEEIRIPSKPIIKRRSFELSVPVL